MTVSKVLTVELEDEKLLVLGDLFEIDTADFQYAVYGPNTHPSPRPKGKKLCKVNKIFSDGEEIMYICQAANPTRYTTDREFVLRQLLPKLEDNDYNESVQTSNT